MWFANNSNETSDEEDVLATAFHEAGHAIIAVLLGRPVEKVSVVRNSLRLGVCQMSKRKGAPIQDEIETQALIQFAGLISEAKWTGKFNWAGAQQDLIQIRQLARYRGASEKQVERLQRRWMDKTDYMLSDNQTWSLVEKLARELVGRKTVSGRFVANLVEQRER
jgi:ATP-dependent Zn protease